MSDACCSWLVVCNMYFIVPLALPGRFRVPPAPPDRASATLRTVRNFHVPAAVRPVHPHSMSKMPSMSDKAAPASFASTSTTTGAPQDTDAPRMTPPTSARLAPLPLRPPAVDPPVATSLLLSAHHTAPLCRPLTASGRTTTSGLSSADQSTERAHGSGADGADPRTTHPAPELIPSPFAAWPSAPRASARLSHVSSRDSANGRPNIGRGLRPLGVVARLKPTRASSCISTARDCFSTARDCPSTWSDPGASLRRSAAKSMGPNSGWTEMRPAPVRDGGDGRVTRRLIQRADSAGSRSVVGQAESDRTTRCRGGRVTHQ